MFGNMNPTCSIRKNAESVERLKVFKVLAESVGDTVMFRFRCVAYQSNVPE